MNPIFVLMIIMVPLFAAVDVFVTEVRQAPFSDRIEALGTLQSNESVELAATVTETVSAVHFDDNRRVAKGALLVELDSREEQAELAEVNATLLEATRRMRRFEPLASRGATSQQTLDEARLDVQVARARLQAIEARIAQRAITAPFTGVLGLRNVSVGALVTAASVITTIDDDSVMKLDFAVPSLHLGAFRPGLAIEATSRAFPGETFRGVVSGIDSRIDPVTRAVTIRARIANGARRLKPGLLMHVIVAVASRQSLVIPEQCIIADGDKSFVLVVVEGGGITTVERRRIAPGVRRGGDVEVLQGLRAGERVVAHGLMKARPGSPVTVAGVQQPGETLDDLLRKRPR